MGRMPLIIGGAALAVTGGILAFRHFGIVTPYQVDKDRPYGPKWGSKRPPGLPLKARKCSRPESAFNAIRVNATVLIPEQGFGDSMIVLADNESDGIFARAANNFDNRTPEKRPPGKGRISAWGLWQWNQAAWQGFLNRTDMMWDVSARDELMLPLRYYAKLWAEVRGAGGTDVDAARACFYWHRRPYDSGGIRGHAGYLRWGRMDRDKDGIPDFVQSWAKIPADERANVDRKVRKALGAGAIAKAQAVA